MILSKVAVGVLGLSVGLFANYTQGVKYYQDGEFKKAFPIVLKEAEKGNNKAAEYRLAEMYEKGKGTEVDLKQSMHWYKQAASKYAYINKTPAKPKAARTFTERLSAQIGDDEIKAGREYDFSKLDTNTPETKAFATALMDGDFFGIKPYQTNFILPISYSQDEPQRISSSVYHDQMNPDYQYYNENVEMKFQLSLKKDLSYNLFGFNEYITAAYTQEVWWQLYDESGPFRETNYRPEIFMTVPSSQSLDDSFGLKAGRFGFLHESNGQEGYRSRSWNRLYLTGNFQWDNLTLSARTWYRLEEDSKSEAYYNGEIPPEDLQSYSDGDDNPDITDYLGYGDLNFGYLYGDHKVNLMLRGNWNTSKGAAELSYSHPFFDSPYTNWYVELFTGYGESLIDYNQDVTKASFGFSFTTRLFDH